MTELMSRCAPAVFIGVKNEGVDGGGPTSFYTLRGSNTACYGLVQEMAFVIAVKTLKEELERHERDS